jgi:hypothetical protein
LTTSFPHLYAALGVHLGNAFPLHKPGIIDPKNWTTCQVKKSCIMEVNIMPKEKRHRAQFKLKVALKAAGGSKTLCQLASE